MIKNRYDINDIKKEYYIDTVTCFEHPIATAIKYFNTDSSECYLALTKLYGVYREDYDGNEETNIDKIIKEAKDVFGIEIKKFKNVDWKTIVNCMDSEKLIIAGVNLYEMFYSEHYLKDNWGHWILINGYDKSNNTLNIFDNAQYNVLGERYGDFKITYRMLKKASKSYKIKYGEENLAFMVSKHKEFNYIKAITYIVSKYIEINISLDKVYRQIFLLKEINKLTFSNENYVGYYIEEFKKKVININKYRNLFFDILINSMKKLNWDKYLTKEMIETVSKQNKEWEKYILRNIVKVVKIKDYQPQLENSIYELENCIQNYVKKYLKYLREYDNNIDEKKLEQCKNNENTMISSTISYKMENNNDKIISGNDKEIIFNFNNNKLYNWWIEDNAPKILLVNENFEKITKGGIKITTHMEVENGTDIAGDELYQAGFYIKTLIDDNSYVCAVENDSKWIFDRIGNSGRKQSIKNEYDIFLIIKDEKIVFGETVGGMDLILFEDEIIFEGIFETGIMCKTWNRPGKLKVKFKDISVKNLIENL